MHTLLNQLDYSIMVKIVSFYENYFFISQKKNNSNHDHDNNGLFTSHLRSGCMPMMGS